MSYQYTKNDLFDSHPYHYMYTPYEGEAFLKHYFESRIEILNKIQSNSSESVNDVLLSEKKTEYYIKANLHSVSRDSFKDELNVSALLQEYYFDHVLKNIPVPVSGLFLVVELARKFEVSKRIRKKYKAGLFPTEQPENSSLETYVILALMLTLIDVASDDLRYINVILKINDHVLSSDYLRLDEVILFGLSKSIEFELGHIRKMLDKYEILLSN
jgi:hypothetical protein